ncbi:MAG: hypothetical protein JO247_23695 [Chloroflexi bacterium]|nr:hypothetical protein [Chloroflexota bacterium]
MIASGAIAPLILVLPQGDQSFWMDAANGGPRFGAYAGRDVVNDVDQHYRTIADREHRAVGGLSMGGFGALSLGMLYPETFSAVGAHSPSLWTLPGPDFFGDAGYFAAHDPVELLHTRPSIARGLKLWLDVGQQDPLERVRTEALHAQLDSDDVPHAWHEWPGDHSGTYWGAHLTDYLHFYDAALR